MLGVVGALVVVAAALWIAARATTRRSELALGFAITLAALIAMPIHVLGVLGWLGRRSAVIAPAATAIGFALLATRLGTRSAALDARRCRALFTLPFEALRVAWRARSVAVVTLLVAGAVVLHALVSGYLLPNDAWDGIWYHDLMIGGALDAGGYAPIPLPRDLIQQANGFPRSAESTSLFLACVLDRRIVEWTNTLAALPLFAATYLVVRRFSRRRATALGFAALVVLVPGCALELRSTYVDVYAAAWLVAATHYATRPKLDGAAALFGALSLALLATSKSSALVTAPVLALILSWRLLRSGVRAAPLAAGGIAIVVAASFALTYARNAVNFGSPLWPYAVRSPALGISWPGVMTTTQANMNASIPETLRAVFFPHRPGRDFADVRIGGFGEAFAWVTLPLALAGVCLALADVARRERRRRHAARALSLLAIVGPALLGTALSPAIWSARYQLGAVALLAAPALYLLSACRVSHLANGALAAATTLACVHLARLDPPLGGASLQKLYTYVGRSAADRGTAPIAPWTLSSQVAKARDAELGPRTCVVFGDGVAFPSVLYTERFEGHLEYVGDLDAPAIARHIERAHPTWIVAAPGEPLDGYLVHHANAWERIGEASQNRRTYAYRRRVPDAALARDVNEPP